MKTYRQPKQLYLLFFTELWERFGFYAVQTIIILYMTKGLKFPDFKANSLYAAFSSLLYLTPAIGGYLADRYLGFKRAVISGGLLLMLGYFLMSLPGMSFFFLGLSVLIVANGLFKPNVSSIIGEFYTPGDPRRDGGFTLFYMGINIGALIPPLFAGALVTHYGWHIGFAFAAVGMIISLIIFIAGKHLLKNAGNVPLTSPLRKSTKSKLGFYVLFVLGIAIAIFLCNRTFEFPQITNMIIEAGAVIITVVTLLFVFKLDRIQRNKMIACLILIAISVLFWALYNQTFTSLTLFADRNMTHRFLGIPVDAEAMQFFNPFFIILCSPILSRLWIYLDGKNLNPSFPAKFALGVLFVSLGFILLAFSTKYFAPKGFSSPWWLVISYFLQTIGELLLSPIGLSMITVLSPKNLVGMMMGVWFFSLAAAFAIGGSLANLAAVPGQLTGAASLPYYHHAFSLLGAFSFIFAILCIIAAPFLQRLIQEPVKL